MDEQNIEERGLRVPHFHMTWLFANPAGLFQILFVENNNIKTRYIHACCHAYWPIFFIHPLKRIPAMSLILKGNSTVLKAGRIQACKGRLCCRWKSFHKIAMAGFSCQLDPKEEKTDSSAQFFSPLSVPSLTRRILQKHVEPTAFFPQATSVQFKTWS